MQAKCVVYFLSLILTLSMFAYSGAGAMEANNVSFQGAGITIDLVFPEDAHPAENIWHNVTVTANTTLTLNFTINIKAWVNQSWQDVGSWDTKNYIMNQNQILPISVPIGPLPSTNNTLICLLYASTLRTSQRLDDLSLKFYTTQVRSLSYSELLALYNEALADHSNLIAEYEELLGEYNGLRSENIFLISSQETLLNDYNEVKANYTSLFASYGTLQKNYDISNASYRSLLTNYQTLQSELGSLQGNYTSLEGVVSNLQQTISESENALNGDRVVMLIFIVAIAGLIVLFLYVKRKKQEPYLVIRKETVEVNKEENK